MEYFILPISWDQQTYYVIYFSNDDDGIIVDSQQKIVFSTCPQEAREMAQKRNLKLQENQELLDLSTVQSWVTSRSSRLPAATLLYRAWNFFGDVATTMKIADHYLGYDEDFISLHDELFWGCNMPGLTQSQELYELDLSQSEIRNLRTILRSGLEIWRQGLSR